MSWLLPSLPSWSRGGNSVSSSSSDPLTNGTQDEEEEDLDVPPPFPLPDSAQRSSASGPSRLSSGRNTSPPAQSPSGPVLSLAPPSPDRIDPDADPPSELNIAILPDSIPLGNMAPPPSTTKRPDFGIQPGGGLAAPRSNDPSVAPSTKLAKKKGKVPLEPGHSALDWARLTGAGNNLRGTAGMFPMRITIDELRKHNTRSDAWAVFDGKVYNITPYIPFHPGGPDEIMRVAGRDGTKLFMLTHSWVNLEYMLRECMVGMLVKG